MEIEIWKSHKTQCFLGKQQGDGTAVTETKTNDCTETHLKEAAD